MYDTRAAPQAAEQANEAKSRFLATMSHEVRTPLNDLPGLAELLKGGSLDAIQTWKDRAPQAGLAMRLEASLELPDHVPGGDTEDGVGPGPMAEPRAARRARYGARRV